MKEKLLKITQKISTWLLVFICLYEIFEHVIIPIILIWWGFR